MNNKKQSPSGKGNHQDKQGNSSIKKLVKLSPDKLYEILDYYETHHSRSRQAIRLITALAQNPDSPTNRLNKGGGVNLSHVARVNNKRLKKFGYMIACKVPPAPIKNSFGEDSGQELWGLYKVDNQSVVAD